LHLWLGGRGKREVSPAWRIEKDHCFSHSDWGRKGRQAQCLGGEICKKSAETLAGRWGGGNRRFTKVGNETGYDLRWGVCLERAFRGESGTYWKGTIGDPDNSDEHKGGKTSQEIRRHCARKREPNWRGKKKKEMKEEKSTNEPSG